jgi:hypothetical protein
MVAAEEAASTEEAVSAEVAAISAVAGLDRVSVAAHVPVDLAVFVVVHLALMARTGQAGREPTAIDRMVRGPMGCTVEEARLLQVHVTAQCQGTERIQR